MAYGEHTDPGLRVVHPDTLPRRRSTDKLKYWAFICAVVTGTGGAGAVVYKAIDWPWVTKAEFKAAMDRVKDDSKEIKSDIKLILRRLPRRGGE